MAGRILRELIIPRCEARTFEVMRGQILRVIEIEGKQVGDLTALNLHNLKEVLSSEQSLYANRTFFKPTRLYSDAPWENLMLTIIDDKVARHWLHGGRCAKLSYKALYNVEGHRCCHENLAEALAPYGIRMDDVPGVFNLFMRVDIDPDTGGISVGRPLAEKEDYIDMRAEMDLLIAISACPSDLGPTNDFNPKPLGVQIYDED